MLLKTVDVRVRRQKQLAAVLEVHREESVYAFAEQLAPFVEEGEDLAGSIDCVLRVLARRLSGHRRELAEAEDRYSKNSERLLKLRRLRDQAARELHRLYLGIRAATRGNVGRAASDLLLGLHGPIAQPHRRSKLMSQVHETLTRLEGPDLVLPEPRLTNLPPLTETWRRSTIELLRTAYDRLAELVDEIALEEWRETIHRGHKDDQMVVHDLDLSAISDLQKAVLVLGRLPDLARKVWQSQRRPRRSEPTEDQPEAEPETTEPTREQAR